jgi:hypothetical protein
MEDWPSVAAVKLLHRDLALPLRLAVGAMFLVIVALAIAQVAARYRFGSPLIWSEEASKLLLVWLVFLGAAARELAPPSPSHAAHGPLPLPPKRSMGG